MKTPPEKFKPGLNIDFSRLAMGSFFELAGQRYKKVSKRRAQVILANGRGQPQKGLLVRGSLSGGSFKVKTL